VAGVFFCLISLSKFSYADPGDVTVINTISPKNNAFSYIVRSTNVYVSTASFSKNLTAADVNLQHAMQTLDQLTTSSSSSTIIASAYGSIYLSSGSISQSISTSPAILLAYNSSGDSNQTTPNSSSGTITVSTSGAYVLFANILSTGASPGSYTIYYGIRVNGIGTGFTCQDTPNPRCIMSGVKVLSSSDVVSVYISASSNVFVTANEAQLYVASVGGSGGGSGGSGTPGGSNTQFQFNSTGTFAGSPDLTTNGSTVTATNIAISTIQVSQNSTFLNVSTVTLQLTTMTFQSGTNLVLQEVTAGNCLQTDSNGVVIDSGGSCGGGGGIGAISLLTPGATNFIYNQASWQKNAQFSVSSGSVNGQFIVRSATTSSFGATSSYLNFSPHNSYLAPTPDIVFYEASSGNFELQSQDGASNSSTLTLTPIEFSVIQQGEVNPGFDRYAGSTIVNSTGTTTTNAAGSNTSFAVYQTTTMPASRDIFKVATDNGNFTETKLFEITKSTINAIEPFQASSATINNQLVINGIVNGTPTSCLAVNSSNIVISTTCSGGGGGGSSGGGGQTLATATGSLAGFTSVVSSPTNVINFSSDTFNGQLRGGSTAFITLNPSSVTLQGVLIAGSNITLTPSAGNTTISVAGSGSASGTSGAVQYSAGGGTFSSDVANFFWDSGGKELGIGTNAPIATITAKIASSAQSVLAVIGAGTSNAQEWMDSGGTVVQSSVSSTGAAFLPSVQASTGTISFLYGSIFSESSGTVNGQFSAIASSANIIPIIVKGFASQSADLQEWQNSSKLAIRSISAVGHEISTGTLPTISTCGTSPSVKGDDYQGTITLGGGVVTACTMTFANTYNDSNVVCIPTDDNATISVGVNSVSATAVIFGTSATLGGGHIYYRCGCSGTNCK
jgi:hypothetical protein